MYLIYSFRTLVIGYTHRFIDFANCTYFFYILVHPLVDRDRKRVDTLYILVFVQYGFRVLIKLYFEWLVCFNRCGGNIPVENVSFLKVLQAQFENLGELVKNTIFVA